jgi:secondary thiamine-phosphate synthase enzyme
LIPAPVFGEPICNFTFRSIPSSNETPPEQPAETLLGFTSSLKLGHQSRWRSCLAGSSYSGSARAAVDLRRRLALVEGSTGRKGSPKSLRQATGILRFQTTGRGLVEISREIDDWQKKQSIQFGLLTLFCRHTSASLLIQENVAPEVRTDLEQFFAAIAPEDPARYVHDDEGADDMPAHIRTALTTTHLAIPIMDGAMALGTWQGVYLFEHRRRPHLREVALHLIGE